MAHSQFGRSALCSLFAVGQTPVLTAGQMCTVLRKVVPLAKWIMAAARDKSDACVILQSWYFHLLVGCNRITGGSGWAEDRPKGDCRHQEHRYRYLKGTETDVVLFEVYLCLSSVQGVSSVLGREELWQKTRKEGGGKWCP